MAGAVAAVGQRPAGRWSIEPWVGLPLDELRARLAALDGSVPVAFTSIYGDPTGRSYFPFDALRQLTEVSRAPIYGWYPTNRDAGLTAGVTLDFERTGEQAARLAAAIRGGQPAAGATAPPAPIRCFANVSRLLAFGQCRRLDRLRTTRGAGRRPEPATPAGDGRSG